MALLPIAAALAMLTGCVADSGETPAEPPGPWVVPAGPAGWPAIVWPADNPYHPDKAALGKELFFDTRLSADGVASCSWCHSERASFADNHHTPLSTGFEQRPTRRNAPTLVNTAFGTSFMFAGDFATLEEQAVAPLLHPDEMNMTAEGIEASVSGVRAYAALYEKAFGPGPVTLANVAKALATFQRTLISAGSPYDLWMAGDSTALTPSQRRGHAVFVGKGDCASCHVPPLFTDHRFYNTGLDRVSGDSGRMHVTGLVADMGKFKTPTLRNVSITHPYMHDGRFRELREVVEHYNSGGLEHPARDPRIRPLGLTHEEMNDLVAFLEALYDQPFQDQYNP